MCKYRLKQFPTKAGSSYIGLFNEPFSYRRGHVFNDHIKSVKPAPDDKTPFSTMPQTTDQENDHEISVLLELSLSIASERYIQIITKPGRQRYMPFSPKIRN